MRRSAGTAHPRTRAVVALVVLTAWFAALTTTGSSASALDPTPLPSADGTLDPSPDPTPSDSPSPDVSPDPTPSDSPTPDPSPSDSPAPDVSPSASPDPSPDASVEPSPTSSPDTSPSPEPSPTPAAPAAPALSGPADTTVGTSATYTVTAGPDAQPGDVQECADVASGGSPAWATCPTSWQPFTAAASADSGTHQLLVRTVRAGAGSTEGSPLSVTLDATPPTIDTISLVPNRPADAPRWTVVTTGAATTTCTVAGVTGGDWCDIASAAVLPQEGLFHLTVEATDGYGNTTTNSAATYTYDVTGPGAPTVSGPSTWTTTPTATWTVTPAGNDTDHVVCTLTGPAGSDTVLDPCGSSVTTPSPTAQGTWSLRAVGYDASGNAGAASAPVATTVDTISPSITVDRDLAAPADQPAWRVGVDADATATCSLTDTTGTTGPATACGTSYTADLRGALGGTYTLHVSAGDAAGHTTTAAVDYVLAPATPVVTVTTPDKSLRPTWSIDAQSNAALTCTLTSPTDVVSTPACAGSSLRTSLTRDDGTWTLDVVATVDGASSPAGTATYVLDTQAPGDVDLGGSSGPQNTAAISWTVTPGVDTARVTCVVTHDGVQTADSTTSCGSTLIPVVSAGATGTWTLAATGYDAVGNASPTATRTVVYDTTAPAAPGVTRTSASPTAARSTTWSLTRPEAGAQLRCRWTGPGAYSTSAATCGTSYAFQLPDVPGSYVLHVAAVDAAGNTGSEQTGTVVYDAVPPVTTFVAPPAGPSNVRHVVWTTTVDEPTSLTECRLVRREQGGDVVVHDWRTSSCGRTATEDLPAVDGTYLLQVRDTDALGNVDPAGTSSPVGYQLDTTGPGVPTVSGPSGDSNVAAVDWTITPSPTDPGTDYDCRLVTDGVTGGWARCDTDGDASNGIHRTATLADGTYRLEVVALDDLRNPSAPVTVSADLRLDTGAPAAAQFAAAPATGRDPQHTWTWTGETGATVTCQLVSGASATDLSPVDTAQPCSSPHTEQLASPTSGTWYALTVTLTDAAGNATSATSPTYRLDTVAPDAPVVTGPSGEGSTRAASYAYTPAESGTTAVCTLVRRPVGGGAETVVSTRTACAAAPTTWSLTLPAVDAEYLVRVVTTDPAGNSSAPGESPTYHLDLTGPAAPDFTAGPSGRAREADVTWTWTAEAGATSACSLTRNGTVVLAQSCTGGSLHTVLAAGDGTYALTVRLTDQYGNAGGSTTAVDYVLDTTPPTTPVVAGPSGPGNVSSATWSIPAPTEPVTAECRLRRDGSVLDDWVTCTLPHRVDLSGDGTYVLDVRLTDAYGNTTPTGSSPAYALDTVAPDAPVVTGPSGEGSTRPASYAYTPAESGTTAVCTLIRRPVGGGAETVVSTRTACAPAPTTWSLTLPAVDAEYLVRVVTTDPAGNSSAPGESPTYHLDLTGPDAPVFTAAPSGRARQTDVTWTWTAEPLATSACSLTRNGTVVLATDCTGGTSRTDLSAGDGTYVLTVRLTDQYGNAGGSATSLDYVLDTTPPTTPVVSGPSGPGNVPSASWSIPAPTEPVTTECRLRRDTAVLDDWSTCALPLRRDLVGDGSYVLDVHLTDAYGNTTPTGSSPAYALDTVAPDAPSVTGPSGEASSRAVSYAFTAEAGTSAVCTLVQRPVGGGAETVVSTRSPCGAAPTTWSVTLPAVDAEYLVRVVTTDPAGNSSAAGESAVYHLDLTGPTAPAFTAGPSGRARQTDVTWTWTYEAGSTSACRLTHDGTVVLTQDCTGGTLRTVLAAGDGAYALTVTLTDRYGNPGGTATYGDYVLDTTPPTTPVVSGPAGPGNSTSATWSIPAPTEPVTVECRLRRDASVVSDWAGCVLPLRRDLVGDGTYVLDVRLTDAYGNTTPVGSSPAYLLDTAAPATPATTTPANPSRDASPTFGVTVDPGTTTTCSLSRGSTVVSPLSPCTSSYTAALTTDGEYVLTVVSVDAAGDSATGTSTPYVFDTTPPAAPAVTGPAGPSQDAAPAFSWTGEDGAVARCSLRVGSAAPGAEVACTSPYAPTLPTDGTWVLSVRLTDAAGNVSTAGTSGGYVLDTTAPATPVVLAPSSPGRNLSPSWSAVTEDGSATSCRFTGQPDFTPCVLPLTTPVSTDGSYTLWVRSTDAAGNVSPVGTGTYVLDTTAPPAPVVTPPTSSGRTRTPALGFSVEAGSTGICRVTRGSTVLQDTAPCSSPAPLDLTGLPDGGYTLTVRAVDAAGNTGPAATGTYVLDTTAPAAPVLTVVPGSPSADRGPVYGFSSDPGTTVTCRLTSPGGVATSTVGCSSPLTLDLSSAAEGDHVLTLTARDAAGNTGPATTTTYTLSLAAGTAPRLTGPATPGSSRVPTWRISASGPAECRLVRGTTVVADWQPCASTYTADLFGQPDGAYLLEARLVGGSATATSRYRLDTTGPAAAVLTAPPSPSTVRRPIWTVAAAEATVTAECRVTVFGALVQDWAGCAVSPAGSPYSGLDLTGRGDGTYTLHVRLTDSAGNVGTAIATSPYVLDTSAPAAVGVVGPASPGRSATPTWTLSSGAGALLECRLTTGSTVVRAYAPCTDTYTADLTGLADGVYTLTVHALSSAGTPGPETTSLYEYDTIAPAAPAALAVDPVGPSQNRAPRWTFVLPAGTTAVCKVTLGDQTFSEGPCASGFVLDLSNAADGAYAMSVRAVDAAGNVSVAATKGYVLRTVPPPAPVFTVTPGSPSATTDPQWAFTTGREVTTQCRMLYEGAVTEDWVACASPYALYLTGRPDGRYTLQVRSVDQAQNTSKVVESSYAFDRSAGLLVQLTDLPASPGNDLTPSWSLTAPAGTAVECRWTGPRGIGAWTACSGAWTGTTTGDFHYLLDVRTAATDTAPAGPVSSASYLLDTVRPAPPVLTGAQPATGNEAEVSWSWAQDPELLVECRLLRGDVPLGPFADCSSPYAVSLVRLGQGTYAVQVRATDLAGNVGDPGSGGYRYDTTPPPMPVFTSRPATRGTATSAAWLFDVPADATALCRLTHDGVVTESPCAGEFRLDRLAAPGTWSLSVQYVDAAGNVGRAALGSYTLLSLVVRDRVDGPTGGGTGGGTGGTGGGGGSGPFTPRPPGGGFDNPDVPAAPVPGAGPTASPRPDHPKLDAIARAAEPFKRAAQAIGKTLTVPRIPGISEGTGVPDAIKNVLGSTITKPQLPLALFFVVVLFLLVQNRIDRRDPKLAAAPVSAEPELAFGPRVRSSLETGGATA